MIFNYLYKAYNTKNTTTDYKFRIKIRHKFSI